MTSTGSVQDRIQLFINSHPDYQGKPLSEFSTELVAAGILTVEELESLDSTSTFSIMQSDDISENGLDSFQHSEEEAPVVLEGERTFNQVNSKTGETEVVTITYFEGKPSTKRVTTESGELIAVYSYSSVKLSNGKDAIAIVGIMAEGDRVEQTVVSDVDENGNYVDDAFLMRSTIMTKDTVLSNGVSAAQGSKQTIDVRNGNLVDIVMSEAMDKIVYTEYNGDSISEYDAQQLHRTYQEINENGIIHSAQYSNGNTRVVVRNNDGFERITRYFNREIDRQGLDDSRHFNQAELEALNPREARRGLQVGQTILVPTEYNANAPILLNRGTPEEAVSRYNQVAAEQTINRLYSSTISEQTLTRNYGSYEELARETLRAQGISNPSAEQLNDRANELIILNRKAPLTKGAKVKIVSNQSSSSDVRALGAAGFKQTPENNAFYVKFNSLDSQQKQQVLRVLKSYSNITDINQLKAIVYETTGVNLYDTSLTINENKQGSMNANFYNASIPLEYFITNRLGLDLNSATGKEVYLRLRSLPQEQLNNISASQFAPSRTNQFGMPNNKISVGSDATLQTVISAMAGQGVELRTSDEIRIEESNPRFIARRKKEEAISFLYNSVNAAYSIINSHLDELKSHMFSNLGEIMLEDIKHYMIPDALKKLIDIAGIKNGTVDGLMKSIFNKRDELRDTLMKISQLRTSSNFERDYKAITGCDYDPDNVHPFLNHVGNAQDFVQTSSFGGNIVEMAAMIYLTAGMGEIGFIKNSGAAVETLTGSRALGVGTRGALTLGTYTAARESLNLIDDFRNSTSLSSLAGAIERRGIQIVEHSGQSALFGFVGGASAQKLFNLSRGAQNFVTNQFSKVFGKGGSVVLSDGAAASSSQVFTPSIEAVTAADNVLAKGAALSGSELMSKVAEKTMGLNWFGKATNLLLEVSTFAGLEITEQAAAGLAREIFTSESELKQAIANNTLDEYLTEKIQNAPEEMWNHFKEQGINLLMLKAVSFAIGAHSVNSLKGQYETLDNSKIYKTEIDGQPKVVVETSNGKLICNSTSEALSFLHQAMTIEAMLKAAPEKPETEPVDVEYTDVTSEYSDMPVYTRENLPENTTIMPSQNLVISTVTGKPVGRLALPSSRPAHLKTGLTPEQSRLLLDRGVSPAAVSDYFGVGLTRVAAMKPVEVTPETASSPFAPTPKPNKFSPREVFKIEDVLTEPELQIKSSDIVRKVGENKFELTPEGEVLVNKMAEQINRVASEIEPEILRIMNSMGLDVGEKFSYRSKSVQSLHDKIQNALFENPDLTLEQALAEVKDAEGVRTLFEAKDYSNHPEVQELLANGDREGAIRRAAELQSNETFEALKRYIDSVAEGTNEVEITRMSNYMGKDGIPYFSEAQLSALKAYAESKGVKLPIVERVTVTEEADGSRTETVNPKSTTKVRGSGYTALQMNFRMKNGFILEGQFRGPKVDNFAEAEHVPYDIRTGKDIIGRHTELTNIYKPIIELLKGDNKISDEMFDEHTAYLTAHYEYLRLTELGFEDGTNPPKFPKGLDARLRAENLELLHEYVEKIKAEPEREAELRAEYESKLVQNTPENTTEIRYNKVEPKPEQETDFSSLDAELKTRMGAYADFVDVTVNENNSALIRSILDLKGPNGDPYPDGLVHELVNYMTMIPEEKLQLANKLFNMREPDDSIRFGIRAISQLCGNNYPMEDVERLAEIKSPDGKYRYSAQEIMDIIGAVSDGVSRRTPGTESYTDVFGNSVDYTMSIRLDEGSKVFDGSVKVVKDSDGNLLYKEQYRPSADVEGKFDIVRTDANGNEWIVGLASKSVNGNQTIIEKTLFGADNTKTDYVYLEDSNGRLSYSKITDSEGNVILNNSRKFKQIDENHYLSVENGVEYDIRYFEDKIVVTSQDGNRVELPIVDNGDEGISRDLIPLMKQLPGSALMDIDKFKLEGIAVSYDIAYSENAFYSPQGNVIVVSPELSGEEFVFTLLHELGHMVDYNTNIHGNAELLAIYQAERNALLESGAFKEFNELKYFTTFVHKNEGGAITEMIAETNALLHSTADQTTIEARGALLQQYFPKTFAKIAELLGNVSVDNDEIDLGDLSFGFFRTEPVADEYTERLNQIEAPDYPAITEYHSVEEMNAILSGTDIWNDSVGLDKVLAEWKTDIDKLKNVRTGDEHKAVNRLLTDKYSLIENTLMEMMNSSEPGVAEKAMTLFEEKVMPLSMYYQSVASIIDNIPEVSSSYFTDALNPSSSGGSGLVGSTPVSTTGLAVTTPSTISASTFYKPETITKINDFLATSKSEDAKDYVTALRDNLIDESVINDFLSMDESAQNRVLAEMDETAEGIAGVIVNQSDMTIQNPATVSIIYTLVLMKIHNPESFNKLVDSKGFKAIKTGELNLLLLQDIKATDTISDNYFYEMFDAKERDLDAALSTNPKFQDYDSDLIKKIIDLDPARQDEILNYILIAGDKSVMQNILTLISQRLTKSEQRRADDEIAGVFTRQTEIRDENNKLIDLIRLAAENPQAVMTARNFRSKDDNLNTLIEKIIDTKLPADVRDRVLDLFQTAHTNFGNIRVHHVTQGLKFMEKFNDMALLEKLLSVKQEKNIEAILKNITENNIDIFRQFVESSNPITTEQLSMLAVLKDYPEAKTLSGATPILAAMNDVMFDVQIGEGKNYYSEVLNRTGLIEIKVKDPAKYARIEDSGLLDMVNSGQIDSAILKQLNINSDLSPELYADLAAVKNGDSIVAEFREGTTLPYAFSKTNVGDVVEIGSKMYLNDGNGLVEWNMTKEKYLELFPPVLRFASKQRRLGDCYFVSSLASSMQNPLARLDIYKSFELQGDDVVVRIKDYEEYGGARVFNNGAIELDSKNMHIYGAKGLQMYEQTYARMALREEYNDPTPALSDATPSHTLMSRIRAGRIHVAMSEMHALKNYGYQEDIPADFTTGTIGITNINKAKFETLLNEYFGKPNVMLGFGTKAKKNSDAESKLLPEYNLVSSHAYSIVGYDPVAQTVTINNPHSSGINTVIPLDKLCKYVSHTDITVL